MDCNRTAEQIRIQFPKANTLIANNKQVFQKAPYRVLKLHTDALNIPLPTQPMLTR